MSHVKHAATDHPISDLLAHRWSPYGLEASPMPLDDLRSLLEAARWAPSAFNEQPWRYLVAVRQDEDAFTRLLSCLVDGNQAWARQASALIVTVASLHYARNDKPNGSALHDVGLASANLTVEASQRGYLVHQMAGILPDRVRELYGVPAGFQPVTAIAVGRAAAPAEVDESLRQRDSMPRTRRPLAEFVFGPAWGEAADLADRPSSG
jgi:nitroreductase